MRQAAATFAPAIRQTTLEVMRRHFRYDSFRGRQGEVIDAVLGGRNCFVSFPTGEASGTGGRGRGALCDAVGA